MSSTLAQTIPPDCEPLARRVAAHGLGRHDEPLADQPLDDEAFARLRGDVIDQRITGHLLLTLLDDRLPVTPEQEDEICTMHESAMFVDLRLEQELLGLAHALDGAGIEYRSLKGVGLAHLDYPDPGLRSWCDNDLLVRAGQLDAARDVVASLGHRRYYDEPRPGFDARFGKAISFAGANGFDVDLHRSLVLGPFGLAIDPDELWAAPDHVTLAGTAVPVLDRLRRFVHVCYHSCVADVPPRLVPIRDVAQILLGGIDLDAARALARRWRGEGVIARAILLADDVLGLPADAPGLEWARGYVPTRFESRSLAVYDERNPSYRRHAVAGLFAVRGFGPKVRYAGALAFPAKAYLAKRRAGYGQRLRQSARTAIDLDRTPEHADR